MRWGSLQEELYRPLPYPVDDVSQTPASSPSKKLIPWALDSQEIVCTCESKSASAAGGWMSIGIHSMLLITAWQWHRVAVRPAGLVSKSVAVSAAAAQEINNPGRALAVPPDIR